MTRTEEARRRYRRIIGGSGRQMGERRRRVNLVQVRMRRPGMWLRVRLLRLHCEGSNCCLVGEPSCWDLGTVEGARVVDRCC